MAFHKSPPGRWAHIFHANCCGAPLRASILNNEIHFQGCYSRSRLQFYWEDRTKTKRWGAWWTRSVETERLWLKRWGWRGWNGAGRRWRSVGLTVRGKSLLPNTSDMITKTCGSVQICSAQKVFGWLIIVVTILTDNKSNTSGKSVYFHLNEPTFVRKMHLWVEAACGLHQWKNLSNLPAILFLLTCF